MPKDVGNSYVFNVYFYESIQPCIIAFMSPSLYLMTLLLKAAARGANFQGVGLKLFKYLIFAIY
jgi:hypothetical protein